MKSGAESDFTDQHTPSVCVDLQLLNYWMFVYTNLFFLHALRTVDPFPLLTLHHQTTNGIFTRTQNNTEKYQEGHSCATFVTYHCSQNNDGYTGYTGGC